MQVWLLLVVGRMMFLDVVRTAKTVRTPQHIEVELSADASMGITNSSNATCGKSARTWSKSNRKWSKHKMGSSTSKENERNDGSQTKVMSILEAQSTFTSWWRQVLSRASCHKCGNAKDTGNDSEDIEENNTNSFLETDSSYADESNDSTPSAARLVRAVMRATVPIPAIASCLSLTLDLTQLGIPEVKLTLGLRGEVSYNTCTECFTWQLEADLAFDWGLELPGIGGIDVGYSVNGAVKLEELPCDDAEESNYCRYLHVFLPLETRNLESVTAKCNSDSPFEILSAFISNIWQRAKSSIDGNKKVYLNELDKEIKTFGDQLQQYLPIFTSAGKPQQVPILVATCRWADKLSQSLTDTPDPFCQLEVVPSDAKKDDNFNRVYGSKSKRPRKADDCSFSPSTQACSDPYLCFFSPGAAHPLQFCRFVSAYNGEIWRSSWIQDSSRPNWNEGHGFGLPVKQKSQPINVAVIVYDYNHVTNMDILGEGSRIDIQVDEGKNLALAREAYLSLQSNISSSKLNENGQSVKLCDGDSLEFWISCPEPENARLAFAAALPPEGGEPTDLAFMMEVGDFRNRKSWIHSQDLKSPSFAVRPGRHRLLLRTVVVDKKKHSKMCADVVGLKVLESSKGHACKFPTRVEVPLIKNKQPSGRVIVEFEWLPAEQGDRGVGELKKPLSAMSGAVESFVAKLSHYSQQVSHRVQAPRPDGSSLDAAETGIEYEAVSGRFLARYKPAKVRGEMWGSGLTPASQQTRIRPKECHYVAATGKCNDDVYCTFHKSMMIGTPSCAFDLAPKMPCDGTTNTKYCKEANLCYSVRTKRCKAHTYECLYGTEHDIKECHKKSAAEAEYATEVNQDKLLAPNKRSSRTGDPLRGLKQAFSYMDEKSRLIKYQLQNVPCTSYELEPDDRVVNFGHVLEKRAPKQTFTDDLNFYSEFLTSAANLFIRTVADVQAIFNAYFTGDPKWDGSCLTARPAFQRPYEFGEPKEAAFGTQEIHSSHFVTRSTKPGSADVKFTEPGNKIDGKDNPWCKWAWASDAYIQAERQAFAHRDSPTGQSGYRHSPREYSSKMMPHFWCEALEVFMLSKEGEQRSTGLPLNANKGWKVDFRAACSQLQFEKRKEAKGEKKRPGPQPRGGTGQHQHETSDDQPDGIFTIWRRYDCENVLLTSHFMMFFPSFIKQVFQFRSKIGTILEDGLMCAGKINEREFAFRNPDVRKHCKVSVDSMLAHTAKDKKRREHVAWQVDFVKKQAHLILEAMREWLTNLEFIEQDLIRDFKYLWDYGQMLNGAALSHQVLATVKHELGDAKSLKKRIEKMKEHLVMKAWMKQGQHGRLFPPPVKFETVLTLPGLLPSVRSGHKNICLTEIPQVVELLLKFKRSGRTYEETPVDRYTNCFAGQVAPVQGVVLTFEGCATKITVEDKIVVEKSFDIGLRSVLAVEDHVAQAMKMTSALTPKAFFSKDEVKDDHATASVAWHMGTQLLTDPGKFLTGSGAFGMDVMTEIAGELGKELKTLAGKVAGAVAERMKQALERALEAISLKTYRILDVSVRFVRVGNGNFEPTFSVFYKKVHDAKISLSVPGMLDITGSIQASQRYDLSAVFSEIFNAFKEQAEDDIFQKCVGCFQVTKQKFCFVRGSIADSKCEAEDKKCPKGDSIVDSMDCDIVDDDQQGGS